MGFGLYVDIQDNLPFALAAVYREIARCRIWQQPQELMRPAGY